MTVLRHNVWLYVWPLPCSHSDKFCQSLFPKYSAACVHVYPWTFFVSLLRATASTDPQWLPSDRNAMLPEPGNLSQEGLVHDLKEWKCWPLPKHNPHFLQLNCLWLNKNTSKPSLAPGHRLHSASWRILSQITTAMMQWKDWVLNKEENLWFEAQLC